MVPAVRFVHLYRRWRGLAELSVGHRSSGALPPGGLVGHSRLAPLGVRCIIVRRLVSRMPRVRCVVRTASLLTLGGYVLALPALALRAQSGSGSTRRPHTVGAGGSSRQTEPAVDHSADRGRVRELS